MANILLYRRRPERARIPTSRQELLMRSRMLLAAARICTIRKREAHEQLRQLRVAMSKSVSRSNEQLRQSAMQLFAEWGGSKSRSRLPRQKPEN